MPEPASPREVFARLLRGIADGAWHDLPRLYAEDAVVEQPFAAPQPTRLEGREAIRQHFATAARGPLELRASNVVVHETGDPEVIIAEFDYAGRVTTTATRSASPTSRCSGSATRESCPRATTTTTSPWPPRSVACPNLSQRSPVKNLDNVVLRFATAGKVFCFPLPCQGSGVASVPRTRLRVAGVRAVRAIARWSRGRRGSDRDNLRAAWRGALSRRRSLTAGCPAFA
jgi:ketosteroid isomerase-like protein